MEIIKNFGLDPYLTIAQIVNFLVILYVLKRFLYPPLFNALKKRQNLVKQTVLNAEEGKQALEKAHLEEKAIIKKAKETADTIIKDAKDQALRVIGQAEAGAKKITETMLQEAKLQIIHETKEAEIQLSRHVSRLSLELLRQSITNIFTQEEQEEIMEKAIQELQRKPN